MGVISSPNHWWHNWSKTHAYVASQMFFPRFADEVASAIQRAEVDLRPLRAVGGGWSFSDASLPGTVTTNRPGVHNLEAMAEALSHAETFPISPNLPSIASIPSGVSSADLPGAMVMHTDDPGGPEQHIELWIYAGAGKWTYGAWTYEAAEPGFLDYLAQKLVRPIRNPMGICVEEADVAGSLVMFDLAKIPARPSRDWFYNGNGVWSVGIAGDSPFAQGDLLSLRGQGRVGAGKTLSPRAARAGESLSLVLSRLADVPKPPDPVYLINTRSLVSSLQQNLPAILSQKAIDATTISPSNGKPRRFYFHVEAGITIAELGELLAHQSPRLSLLAISGSPGATLAGALSSATHGAEFNWPLLVDTVKAVHLVGPGGLQWWIEGDESIADPQKLRAAYPTVPAERIISGTAAVAGISPQDWLNAAIVSMGSMAVLYSVVLEVVPLFGVHETVVQTSWRQIGAKLNALPPNDPVFQTFDLEQRLRFPLTAKASSSKLLGFLLDGTMNDTGIPARDSQGHPVNQYADLAINPNRRRDGDFDCWIGNREQTWRVPIDPRPSPGNETVDMLKGITMAFSSPDLVQKLRNINQLGSLWDIIWNISATGTKLTRLTQAADFIDVALDTFLTPMIDHPDGPEVAGAFLSGMLAGLLGTANCDRRSDKTGVSVGALGFPASGVMGTGLEIALAPADAFAFLQTEILDKVDANRPFFGYVSIRVCSMTKTLMGMQQFGDGTNPCSVMIEVVAFASDNSRQFIRDLQMRTVNRISAGLDAMLHWGLENDLVTGQHLRNTMALQRPTSSGMSKLDTFKAVRALVQAASPSAYRTFDNGFTDRLWLSSQITDDDPYSFQTVQLHARKAAMIPFWNHGSGPMRVVGVSLDGDFRTSPSFGNPGKPSNLEIGPLPAVVTPVGDFFELPVTFIAAAPGSHQGVLTIVTHANIPNSVRIIRVRLHALVESFAVSLILPAAPAVLDLGAVELGQYASALIAIRSDSTMSAWLDSYELSTPSATGQVGVVTTGVGPISPGQTRSYSVTFEPTLVGPLASDLTLSFSDRISPPRHSQQLTLRVVGNGVGVQAALAPATIDFGMVGIGSESAPQTVELHNVGQQPLIVSGILIGSDFRLDGPRPSTVAPGQVEEMIIVFRPGHGGFLSSALSVSSNSARPPLPVSLHGVGIVQALLRATPPSLAYGATPVGSQSGEELLTVANAGALPVELIDLSIDGPDAADFRIVRSSQRAGAVLRPEDTCEIRVVFAPTGSGPKAAMLKVSHDGATSPMRVALQGLAIAVRGLVPSVTDLDFGPVALGVGSKTMKLVMTNATTAAVRITDLAITGRAARDFTVVSQLGRRDVLEPGTTRTIGVSVQPSALGPCGAELTVTADVSVTVVSLRAMGLGATVQWSAALVDFGTWKVGQQSERRDAYIRNTGTANLVVTLVDAAGDFTVQDLGPMYMSIPPNGDKYFWVWFTPTAAGTRDGSLRVHVSGSNSPETLALTGVGF